MTSASPAATPAAPAPPARAGFAGQIVGGMVVLAGVALAQAATYGPGSSPAAA